MSWMIWRPTWSSQPYCGCARTKPMWLAKSTSKWLAGKHSCMPYDFLYAIWCFSRTICCARSMRVMVWSYWACMATIMWTICMWTIRRLTHVAGRLVPDSIYTRSSESCPNVLIFVEPWMNCESSLTRSICNAIAVIIPDWTHLNL